MNTNLFKYLSKINMQLKTLTEQALKQYKLNFSSFSVLNTLYNNDGTDNVSSICEKLIIKNSSMTYVIKRLEERDLLNKIVCPNDKRNFNLELTNKGKILMSDVKIIYNNILNDLLIGLTKAEKETVVQLLEKISVNCDALAS